MDWWAREYYRVLDDWVAQHRFAGKDQNLMIDIFESCPDKFLLLQSYGKPIAESVDYPHLLIFIRYHDTEYAIGDAWFFFEPFLAANADLTEDEKAVLKRRTQTGDEGDGDLISLVN